MNEKIFKNFSYIALGQVVATGLQAGFYLIFASILEPEFYGQMSYLIAVAGIAALFSRFGFNYSVTVYQAKEKQSIANQLNVMVMITSLFASLILLFFNEFAAILCMSLNFFAMTQHNLLGLKKYKQQMLTAIVKSILIITIPILLYFMMEINGILLGMAISNVVVCSPYFMSLRKNILKFQDIKKKFRAITGNFGIDLSSTFPIVADKLLIVPLFGFVYVGIYQFNLQILFALGILPVILHAFLLPEEASGKIHKKIIYISIIVSFVIVILGIFFAPIVVNELFPKYHDGIQSLQIMIVSLIPLSISSVFSAKLQARESTKIGISAIVRVASLLGLIMLLGDLYGLEGFSYAVLISTILYAVSLAILYYFSRSQK